ncbi:MAG: TRAM domain-containing protein, partial [Pseudomonadota bacterium]|nr:TRAM domain-containing protein [Pseudomonadota bacterium]
MRRPAQGMQRQNAQPRGRVSREPETAKITDLSHEGRGVAHVDGKTVFIDDALPGELVEWQRLKRGSSFDEGRLLRVIEPSPDRVEPRCIHFGMCGGCVLQHLSSEQQLQFKQKQLTDSLTRIGKVTPRQMLPPLQAGTWNYRRRARLAARWVPKKNRTMVGFRERSTPYITDLRHPIANAQRRNELGQRQDEPVQRRLQNFASLQIR